MTQAEELKSLVGGAAERQAFLAEIGHDESRVTVITTPEGDREVQLPLRP